MLRIAYLFAFCIPTILQNTYLFAFLENYLYFMLNHIFVFGVSDDKTGNHPLYCSFGDAIL